MIKAVFFDLDGVLIDSETIQHRYLKETIAELKLGVPAEAFIALIGSHKSLNPWDQIIAKYELRLSREELAAQLFGHRRNRFLALNKREILFPEVPEVLQQLRMRGIRTACVSSSSPDYIEKALTECGIREQFDLIVSSDNFQRSKPAPDIYLYCLDFFQLSSDACLAVEDSPIGIAAAKAAGLEVMARINPEIDLDQSAAQQRISSLKAVLDYVNSEVREHV